MEMKCDCGLLIHPQYCRNVMGEEGKDLIKDCFKHCPDKKHNDPPSFLNNLCGCVFCPKCIKSLIREINKSEDKESDIVGVICICNLQYDYSLLEKVESKDNVMPNCRVEDCKNRAQLKNYFWCDCFFCLECLRKHLDKHLVDGFRYKKIKCLACKEGLSPCCIPFAGREYFKITQSEKNKKEYDRWIKKTFEKAKHKQEEGEQEGEDD